MRNRSPIGYVVRIDGVKITINLLDQHKGQVAGHYYGVASVGEVGNYLGICSGIRLFILKITGLFFSEPQEVHGSVKKAFTQQNNTPLRQVEGVIVGWIENNEFISNTLSSPSLGSEVFPLTDEDVKLLFKGKDDYRNKIILGNEYTSGVPISTSLNALLSRHIAVLGASGQGKSCFTAAILQEIVKKSISSRIVIFDVNGEYYNALKALNSKCNVKHIVIGRVPLGGEVPDAEYFQIPYFALGKEGLSRLFLPSEKTQRPALSFAIKSLPYVGWNVSELGVTVDNETVFYDDCRPFGSSAEGNLAYQCLCELRRGTYPKESVWPNMKALSALVADSQCITIGKFDNKERNSFYYSNVAPLVTRINRLAEDDAFGAIVNVNGGEAIGQEPWEEAQNSLVNKLFGEPDSADNNIHLIDLTQIPHDLMPLVLGALLDVYAHVLFKRGVAKASPTLLVLEEAHHYLRTLSEGDTLAYERLSKEGRKFGVSLWLSTQRPAEVSPTVLAQCGTWVCFRLTSGRDLEMVSAACDQAHSRDLARIPGLPRQSAIVFGAAIPMPVYIRTREAKPLPQSHDSDFDAWICPF